MTRHLRPCRPGVDFGQLMEDAVIPPFRHRRRSDLLAELIDNPTRKRRHSVDANDPELIRLAGISRRLTTYRAVDEPSPEFRDQLRAMLIATMEREGIGDSTPTPPDRRRSRIWLQIPLSVRSHMRLWLVGVAVALIATITGMSYADGQPASPGSSNQSGETSQTSQTPAAATPTP